MKTKTVFFCTDCGNETPKWQGKCSACGAWNTIVEHTAAQKQKNTRSNAIGSAKSAVKLKELDITKEIRFDSGISEFNRVLGGGAVRGSLVLVGGAPGIGKSTLLLQVCEHMAKTSRILYVTGEESERQLKMRAERLGVMHDEIFVLSETNLAGIISTTHEVSPEILIVDSIQTLCNEDLSAAPGSISQVKDCAFALMNLAKSEGITIFLIGHINKDGAIAGPMVLEHMVDCVLYFEGEKSQNYRILRAIKNRFGSTNEIGVFEMNDIGLVEVTNPSEMLLAGRPENAAGTCVTCIMEGTRPILAEIQALVTSSNFNVPRRNTNGVDFNRAMMILAVLEKRCGMRISSCDAYINVIGGLTLSEPSVDLAILLSIVSSYRDKPIDSEIVVIGEIGLSGELRAVNNIEMRLAETARLGFRKCIIPKSRKQKIAAPKGVEIIEAASIQEAISTAIL